MNFLNTKIGNFDVASKEELNQLLKVADLQKSHIRGVGYAFSNEDIEILIKKYDGFDFQSLTQLERYLDTQDKLQKSPLKIGIRVRTSYNDNNSRFGISIEEINMLKKILKKYNVSVNCLHIHGGQKTIKSLEKDISTIKEWLRILDSVEMESLNFGGSWDYIIDNNLLDIALKKISCFEGKNIILEPGSAIVRNSGILITSLIDKFTDDLGYEHCVCDTSNFNISSWFTPSVIAQYSPNQGEYKNKSVYLDGITCFEGDSYGEHLLSKRSVGDKLYLFPVGAYYFTTKRNLHLLDFPEQILI